VSEDYVEYYSNNSGGVDWLTLEEWDNLRKEGWQLRDFHGPIGTNETLKGRRPKYARRYGLSMRDAIDEFERLTNQDAGDPGCSCCGPPHEFSRYVDGKYAWI